jgi:hypothetical protein
MLHSVSPSSQWYSDYLLCLNDDLWQVVKVPDSHYEVQTLAE